jgi:hypothetical protein
LIRTGKEGSFLLRVLLSWSISYWGDIMR